MIHNANVLLAQARQRELARIQERPRHTIDRSGRPRGLAMIGTNAILQRLKIRRSRIVRSEPVPVRNETQRERVRQSLLLRPEPRPDDGREA